jgi:hypothetical protein
MSTPTEKQLSYLNALITKAGMTQEQFNETRGLYETSPWGKRLRAENITRASVSRWITQLKEEIARKETMS